MTRDGQKPAKDLGQLLATKNSIPEYIQVILAGGAMVTWLVLLAFDVGSVFVTIPATLGGALRAVPPGVSHSGAAVEPGGL